MARRTRVTVEVETPDWWTPEEVAAEIARTLSASGMGVKSLRAAEVAPAEA